MATLEEVQPQTLLEVGSGTGSFAKRCALELLCGVTALDSSPAMVAASRAAGVDAVLGDVQCLDFPDEAFDAVVAAWMLYHVLDLESALAEIVRVLRPGGRLVAITNGRDHLAALWKMVDVPRFELNFDRENGTDSLSRHFAKVARHDLTSQASFPDRTSAAAYLVSLRHGDAVERLPADFAPFVANGTPTVFVADKANCILASN